LYFNLGGLENDPLLGKLQTVSTLWLQGDQRNVPTVNLKPLEMARYYNLDKPCRILLEGRPDLGGILIRYFGPKDDRKTETGDVISPGSE
jgi:hypothetical protein